MNQAGFEVTGVDINNNHQYPFEFIHSDVFDLSLDFLKEFDFIWASPPCQAFTWATCKDRTERFPDLVDRTRQLLLKTGKPFVLENVIGAPLRKDLILCGEMFGLCIVRHRIFELHAFHIPQPYHKPHKEPIDKTHSAYCSVSGHGGNSYSFRLKDWQKAMGIYHITKREHLTQAVPPAYSRFIGKQF